MKILNIVLLLSLGLFVFALSAFEILDPDTLNYLAYGKYIAANGLPRGCIFTYTLSNCTTVFLEWFLYLIIFGLFSIFSWPGLVFLQVTAVFSTCLIVLISNIKERVSLLSITMILFFSLLVMQERFMLRADPVVNK